MVNFCENYQPPYLFYLTERAPNCGIALVFEETSASILLDRFYFLINKPVISKKTGD